MDGDIGFELAQAQERSLKLEAAARRLRAMVCFIHDDCFFLSIFRLFIFILSHLLFILSFSDFTVERSQGGTRREGNSICYSLEKSGGQSEHGRAHCKVTRSLSSPLFFHFCFFFSGVLSKFPSFRNAVANAVIVGPPGGPGPFHPVLELPP